ncbi:arginine--tRNA ligase [Marixanthomonas sp. SCSIO 43207]|uniref:arginine--tRNA ligase n=1 Tax=Marixanthomonas sp. SCSIO 43207 TaxID=2779360 RepID=UPI001CA980B6|nr:arginine--tRNA ligase [Marixanthomonas sp. SCSIO 43207]UAB79961.1 arginine--tRNA ligase [Marixanthomonas sp. SCSIO 43207]
MQLQEILTAEIKKAVQSIFDANLETVEFQATRKDFEGDITVVVFPMLRTVKGNPVQIGESIGAYLVDNVEEVSKFNVVKGFLNLVLSDAYYLNFFSNVSDFSSFGKQPQGKDAVLVEYSSPNTNKPLHLGHIRNILLGYSVAEILKASGKKTYKTQIINDRGIHICKSMLAWQRYGDGETPESSDLKGDKLVGNYYVRFDKEYKKEVSDLQASGKTEDEAKAEAPILKEAQQMLQKWEKGDDEVVALWKKMNGWVYDGFEKTYDALGVDFDSYYYESNTYLLGKDNIEEGLKKGVFFKKEDGSVWCDLTDEGLDEKLVLRADGTAVYMTQDIGTAIQRIKDHPDANGMIYTVGNEQDYHFKVLFLILKKLGYSWAENLYHLSYGMVDLPSGKMKSREGTVVDADDLITEMAQTAGNISEELGKIDDFTQEEKQALYKTIGLGALKYYILKVDPKKRILFNPEESVDFQGNTGPFIQYTYARIQSILRKANSVSGSIDSKAITLHEKEKGLLKQLQIFPETIQLAAENYSPALIANYTYDLVKEFNSFYQNVSILGADHEVEIQFRVQLADAVAKVIKTGFELLGIDVPERM